MATGTRTPSTIITVNLTGQTEFNIPFEYLARKFVIITLLGIDRKVLTLNTDYRFVSKTKISLTNPTPAGYDKLELRRQTSASERLVDFHDGSILRAADMNLSQIQTLHVAEEARDLTADTIGVNDEGHLDARGRKIVNLGDATEPSDAVTLRQEMEWANSALNSANLSGQWTAVAQAASAEALRYRDETFTAREVVIVNAGNAHRDAVFAGEAKVAAEASATQAKASEATSITKAAEAAQSVIEANLAKDRAIFEAAKLANNNALAAAIENVNGNDLYMKGSINARTKFTSVEGLYVSAGSVNVTGSTNWFNVPTDMLVALATQGDIDVYPPVGGQPNGEGGQIRIKDKDGQNTGGFIDVDSAGNFRIVKEGAGSGLKIYCSNSGNVHVLPTLYAEGGVSFSPTVRISTDGNILSGIFQQGTLHADLNSRLSVGNNRLFSAREVWSGNLNGNGPWDINCGEDIKGLTIAMYFEKDRRMVWETVRIAPQAADFTYSVGGYRDMGCRLTTVYGETQVRIEDILNCRLRNIQVWK